MLHTLRSAGHASLERLQSIVATLADVDVEEVLLDLGAAGLVRRSPGDFGGWGLTDAGRQADAELIAAELDEAGTRAEIQAAFDAFLLLNPLTLDICGDWQVRRFSKPMVLNDHSDPVYDQQVLARLVEVNADAQPICERLGLALFRFSHYGPRLADAVARAEAGELGYVTDSLDSFHSVWFQLHEDLLSTLGIPRST